MCDIAELDAPEFLAAVPIDGEGLAIQRVEEHATVRKRGAPIHRVTAGDPLGGCIRVWIKGPARRPSRLIQGDREELVRVRRHHIQGVSGDDGSRLQSFECPR